METDRTWNGLQRTRSDLESTNMRGDDSAIISSVGLAGFEGVGGAWWRTDALVGLKLALPDNSKGIGEDANSSGKEWRDATIVRSFPNGYIVRWSDAESTETESEDATQSGHHRLFGVALKGEGQLRVPASNDSGDCEHECPLKRKVGAKMDKATLAELKENPSFKKCPNCKKWLQKSDGCDVMLCGNTSHQSIKTAVHNGGCGFQFNWKTGKEWHGARYNLEGRGV